MEIMADPDLIVQSEERLLEAALRWIEKSRCTEVHEDLCLKDQLQKETKKIRDNLAGLHHAAISIDADVFRSEEAISAQQLVLQESKRILQVSEISTRQLQNELILSTQVFEKSSRALGGMKTEQIFQLYKSPKASTQRLLEAVAVLLGKEAYWKSTQRMCADGNLAHAMMQFDVNTVATATIAAAEQYLNAPMIRDNSFAVKPAKMMCMWLKAACSCAALIVSLRTENERTAVLSAAHEQQAAAERAAADQLAALRASARAARAAWMQAEADLFVLELRERLCVDRLRRDAARLERCAHRVLTAVKWPFLSRDFLAARVLGDPFAARFLLCSPRNAAVVRAAAAAPTAAFLHAAGSAEAPIVSAVRQGRHYSGSARQADEDLLSRRGCRAVRSAIGAPAAAEGGLTQGGLAWSRERMVTELGKTGRPAAVGCTARGSLVAVSGKHVYVAGGLDPAGRATARVFRAALTPAGRPLAPGDWEQLPFLSTERAFACGGVMLSRGRPGPGPGSPGRSPPREGGPLSPPRAHPADPSQSPGAGSQLPESPPTIGSPPAASRFRPRDCLFVAGGYSGEGRWLRSVEVLELPAADHWRRLPPLAAPRALAAAWVISDSESGPAPGSPSGGGGGAGESQSVLMAVGGVDEHSNRVGRCERVDVPLGFDDVGAARIMHRHRSP